MQTHELERLIFQKNEEAIEQDEDHEDEQNLKKYFTVQVTRLMVHHKTLYVLKINDITMNIHFNLSKGKKKLLQLINACVSHEMRNPLNSIMA
jgi:nitrogen fixation/metabolism regulation signal transduction histidine kinase